jgi:serine/threonine-protein kinase
MGVVYLAVSESTSEQVALKILPEDLSEDPQFRRRFAREVEMAGALHHPNALPVLDSGEDGGVLYLVMPYVEGEDLGALLGREAPLPPVRAMALLGPVASALETAHTLGLVHRDVKPANILLDRQGRVYLADFGVGKRMAPTSSLTGTGQHVGTLAYMAPEQIEGKAVDARTDVYSLGCLLFECLTGQPPFPRDSQPAVMHAHMWEPPPRPSILVPTLPPAMDQVIARAMAKEPAQRHASCSTLMAAASDALAGRHVPPPEMVAITKPTISDSPTEAAPTMTRPVETPQRSPQLPPPRRSSWPAVAAALIVVAGAVGGIVAWRLTASKSSDSQSQIASGTIDTSSGPSEITPTPHSQPSSSPRTPPPRSQALLSFLGTIETELLPDSVDARRQLQLGYGKPSVAYAVWNRRGSELQRVKSLAVPAEARQVAHLLAKVFEYSRQDDWQYYLCYQRGDPTCSAVSFHRDSYTHPAKDAFMNTYNRLRLRAGVGSSAYSPDDI